ncbi:MAG: CHAT domain-containing protein [Anaerolineaceae bacterium]|nr:CHAT domain-containing protein [Anaerolineaceae bacterium]
MGILIWNLGNIEESERHFGDAAKAFEKTGDKRSWEFCDKCLEIIKLYNLGKEDRRGGFFYRSLERLGRASLLGRETGIPDLQLKCLRQEALVFLDLRKLDAFLDKSERGLAISKRIEHRVEQSRFLNNIGVYYQQKNDYYQAIVRYEEALTKIRTSGDHLTEAECLNNIGLAYRELGNSSRAQDYLTKALELDIKLGNMGSVTMDLSNIGSLLLQRGIIENRISDLDEAFGSFQRCLSLIGPSVANEDVRFTALNNMGVILNELGNYEAARRHFEQALMLVKYGRHELEKGLVLGNIGTTYLDEQNFERALGPLKQSYQIGIRNSFENLLAESCYSLGQCYEKRQEPAKALSFYLKAVEALEGMRARIVSESFMIGFVRNKFGAFERAIHILAGQYIKQPTIEACKQIYCLVERMRARAFLESIHEARIDLDSTDLSSLNDRQQAISRIISNLTIRLAEHLGTDENVHALKRELELAEEDYARVVNIKKKSKSHLGDNWRNRTSPMENIQRMLLAERAVLLEYFLDEEKSYLISISSNDAELHVLPSQDSIEISLRAYLKFLSDPSLDPWAGVEAAERIGRELIPFEVREQLNRANGLIVIPDGILHFLPFEAIRLRGDIGSRYIVEDQAVSYGPSASVLFALRDIEDQAHRQMDVLIIGGPDYGRQMSRAAELVLYSLDGEGAKGFLKRSRLSGLPYSKKEVRNIVGLLSHHEVDVLTGEAANEGTIKNWPLKDYKIIHFACHGFVNKRYPLRSALALSTNDSPEEDGLLQMREICGLTIRADLVVLSACRTAIGRLERSESPMALARSFFTAGARSVMSSLWAINDRSTSLFMREFYKHLVRGSTASDAMRIAKIKFLKSRWTHPYFWSGYQLHGDQRVVLTAH